MGLIKSLAGLAGLAVGGPMGAALAVGATEAAQGGDFKDILGSGLKGFFGGTAINSGLGALKGAGMMNTASPAALAQAGGGAANTISPLGGAVGGGGGGGIASLGRNIFGGGPAGGGTGLMGLMKDNPLITALALQAYDENRYPDGVKTSTPLQERQLATGERLPDYEGRVFAPMRYAAQGGMIEGPGTGTSDDIPATIYQNGSPVQEARLSDGEFVLREKDVLAVGDGDREKGAARLYAMQRQVG